MIERFDGAAIWAGLEPADQAAIGAIALELVAAWHVQECVIGDGFADPVARAGDAADALLMDMLQCAFVDAVVREEIEGADGAPRVPSLLGPICRICSCSETYACPEGCGWAEPGLCTACAAPARGMMGRAR